MPTRKLPDPIIVGQRTGTVTAPTGQITIGQTTYGFPTTDGQPGQVLVTSGTGQLTWQPAPATSATFNTPSLFQSSISFKPTDVFSTYTVGVDDNFIRYRGVAPATITLPSAATVRQLIIESQSDVVVTIKADGADTIDGDTGVITLDARFAAASMMSDGLGNWLLI